MSILLIFQYCENLSIFSKYDISLTMCVYVEFAPVSFVIIVVLIIIHSCHLGNYVCSTIAKDMNTFIFCYMRNCI